MTTNDDGNAAEASDRTMVISRMIKAPVGVVWAAWMDAETLPLWWGPDGFSCRTTRIDLREGGEWVFDMIGPDGTVYPNHHRYVRVEAERRIAYLLLRGEDGPKHADAVVTFEDVGGATQVTLRMTLATVEEYHQVISFGAEAMGLQTLGKLARFVGAD